MWGASVEIHGDRSDQAEKLVLLMGLNGSCWGWEKQIEHFGAKSGYQVLAFDNRGVGNSDAPSGRYKTSEMAQDVVELLDYLGWSEPRQLHVCGVSMGGMISQELALAIPERVASLTLLSTKAGGTLDLPTLPVVSMFARLLTGHLKPENALPVVAQLLFPTSWLDQQDTDEGRTEQTNRTSVLADMKRRLDIGKRQTKEGGRGQMAAVWTHKVSADRLKELGTQVPRVAVVTGDQHDHFIHHSKSLTLHASIPGSTLKVYPDGGHAIMVQYKHSFNALLEEIIAEGRSKSSDSAAANPS